MRTKTITISIRLKPDELNVIEGKARESGMNRNAYIITSLVNKQVSMSPELLCRLRQVQSLLINYTGELTESIKTNRS